jgi:hypothetical protein
VTWNCPGLKVVEHSQQGGGDRSAVRWHHVSPTEKRLLVNAARWDLRRPSSLNASHDQSKGPENSASCGGRRGGRSVGFDRRASDRLAPALAVTKAPEGAAVRADVFREIVGDGGKEGSHTRRGKPRPQGGARLASRSTALPFGESRLEGTPDAEPGRLLFARAVRAARVCARKACRHGRVDLRGAADGRRLPSIRMNRVRFKVFRFPERKRTG